MISTLVVVLLVALGVALVVRGGFLVPSNHPGIPGREGYVPRRAVGVVVLVLAVVVLGAVSTFHVDAKNVAVVTSFGKPVGQAQAGLHLKWPWQRTTEIDGTVQPDEFTGASCIPVRIGDGSQSCLSATIRWHINLDEADDIYASYRSNDPTDVLRTSVVTTQFDAAAQDVLSQYNPIATLKVVEGSDARSVSDLDFAPDYDQISQELTQQMATRLGDNPQVVIESITVSGLSLAESTQQKLNDFIAAVGDTRIAAQERSTKEQEALGLKKLAAAVRDDPNVLQSKCLDLLGDAIAKGYQLPAGFNCLGGGGGTVVVPSSR